MPKEILCPKCHKGTLEKLNDHELQKLKNREGKDNYPDVIYGCDECHYWCDAEDIDK